MKRKAAIGLVAVGVIAVGLLVWCLVPRSQEPLYEGKTVGYWLAHPQTNQVNRFTRAPYPVFPGFDSNAVPSIAQALETKDGHIKGLYMRLWNKFPTWIQKLTPEPVSAQTLKRNAFFALAQIGPKAKPAIPVVVRCIKEDTNAMSRYSAVITLSSFGMDDKVVRDALSGLTNDPGVQAFASFVMSNWDHPYVIPSR